MPLARICALGVPRLMTLWMLRTCLDTPPNCPFPNAPILAETPPGTFCFDCKSVVALQWADDKYLSAHWGGDNGLVNLVTNNDEWEKWTEVPNPGDSRVSFLSYHGNYLSSVRNDGPSLVLNNGEMEKWTKIHYPDGSVAIKSSDGRYFSTNNGVNIVLVSGEPAPHWKRLGI
jgi:hypothetical protein